MSGILFLGSDDFCVRAGEKGNMMCLSGWKGLTLVMFYSKECQFCHKLINKFKQLPTIVNGCKFAMCCINRHFDIVEKSKNTIAPIEYVPDVILYVDGAPYIRYDGPHEVEDIKSFIFNVYERLQKTCFSGNKQQPQYNNNNQQQQQPHYNNQPQQQQQPQYNNQQQPQYNNNNQQLSSHDQVRRQQQQQQQQPNYNISQCQQNNIPAYTIGQPLCGQKRQDRCYLEFKTAYPGRNN
jgi:thioredoxin-like negative regulator of GroEL